jgi:CRP/FNR family transcriptional regulator
MSAISKLLPTRKRTSVLSKDERIAILMRHLIHVELFRDLSKTEMERLFGHLPMYSFPKDTLVFTPDDMSDNLYILKMGAVDIYRLSEEGKRLSIRRLFMGSVFGEMGLLGQSMHGCFAETVKPSLVCVMSHAEMETLLRQRPDVGLRFFKVIGDRLKALEDQLARLAFSPVSARVATFLLTHLDPANSEVRGFTHEEIGDSIGALRTTVTQALGEMARAGVLEVRHKCIYVRSMKNLAEFVRE